MLLNRYQYFSKKQRYEESTLVFPYFHRLSGGFVDIREYDNDVLAFTGQRHHHAMEPCWSISTVVCGGDSIVLVHEMVPCKHAIS